MPYEDEDKYKPRIHTRNASMGRLGLKIEGEQYSGLPPLDTRVTIEGGVLCYITWEDRDKLVDEINAIIEKYNI